MFAKVNSPYETAEIINRWLSAEVTEYVSQEVEEVEEVEEQKSDTLNSKTESIKWTEQNHGRY